MTLFGILSALLGGLGLFMLGMWLMSDGLKLAAGEALRGILSRFTQTPARGLAAGALLTATVQSSTAVTVSTVGFVNAGLLTLGQAVWIIYGSNIGTTVTGWIVAMTGVELKLDRYALPLIGIGMLLRLWRPGSRHAALGQALAGFALFLLGIQTLKANFSELAQAIDFGSLPQHGLGAYVVFFGIGLVLTVLIHSSSATTAIAITATAGGLLPVHLAALIAIGADLGTSSTAALATIGATPNARRAAATHVLFNLVTTGFALLTLPWLMQGVHVLRDGLGLPDEPGVTLALFSTAFNVLGVVLMLPLTGPMVRFLERRFGAPEEDLAQPRHLDPGLVEVPTLALSALERELRRIGGLALQLARDSCERTSAELETMRTRAGAIARLADRIRAYVGRMHEVTTLPAGVGEALAPLLRALQHYEEVTELAVEGMPARLPDDAALRAQHLRVLELHRAAFALAEPQAAAPDLSRLEQAAAEADGAYEAEKSALLLGAARGELEVERMEAVMQDVARIHHALERTVKATQRLARFVAISQPAPA